MTFGKRAVALLAVGLLSAATGCSTKANDSGSGGDNGGDASGGSQVKTSQGVSGNTITLGVLTDLTGVFAALGSDITNANQLYWDKNKVCDKYDVKLIVKDTGYVPQQGVQLYSSIKNDILAMQQTIGSPINTALEPAYTSDKIVNLPSAWARNLTNAPGNGVVGATYDIEMTNGLSYALDKGLIKEGDKLGHIYFEGEYGANGLAGSKYFAGKHKMTVVEAKIKATDLDMSSQITQFKAAGVKAILLTVSPKQTLSVASVAGSSGLDVPIIGNNPVFSPALLKEADPGQGLRRRRPDA
ncbi:MAG: ABC transporter substrate-binding protein [Actinobacteria bacterium]|nr:ABC transporter substrate-binding protein [Actinomycetota bacterium]